MSEFLFDDPKYAAMGKRLAADYKNGTPFPHIVIDDFLPMEYAEKILAEFPSPDEANWHRFDSVKEKKLATQNERNFGPFTRRFLYELNSASFLEFLESLTGIDGLIPDPHFRGGGMHQIQRGGWLKIHADFNKHDRLWINRKLNLLIYLSKDWKEEYGGHIEFWDVNMTGCVKKVLPVFNRCVIFSTTDTAYHGHPDPLTCPEGRTRKSLALYYYTNDAGVAERDKKHSTLFKSRPGERLEAPPEPLTGALSLAGRLLPGGLKAVLKRSLLRSKKP